jgi:hypothetical protein
MGMILVSVGIFLVFIGIDGPLIAGSILCGATLISRQLQQKGIAKESNPTEPSGPTKCEPVDADNQITRP